MITPQISFVLPVFNEEMNITGAVEDIVSASASLGLGRYEIIIVNDGSTDSTKRILNSLRKKIKMLRIINFEKNRGYADALKEGFKAAKYLLVFYTDADRQCDIKELGSLLDAMEKYKCDCIFGYRKERKDSLYRILATWVFNVLARKMFDLDLRDINCPFKLFKKRVLDNIQIKSKGFLVDLELATKVKHCGFIIKQVPVTHRKRYSGKSKLKFRTIFKTFFGLLKLRKYEI